MLHHQSDTLFVHPNEVNLQIIRDYFAFEYNTIHETVMAENNIRFLINKFLPL